VRLVERWLPRSALNRVRLAALGFALYVVFSLAPMVDPGLSPQRRAAAAAALALIGLGLLVTFLRRRVLWPEPLLSGPLVVLAGLGATDPLTTIGLSMAVGAVPAMYGSLLSVLLRGVLVLAALPVVVALSPSSLGRTIHWYSGNVLGMLPFVVVLAVLMRVLFRVLVHGEGVAARERLTAEAARGLLGVTDVETVHHVMARAVARLQEVTPGLAWVALRRAGGYLVVEESIGITEALDDVRLPESVVAGLDEADPDTLRPMTAEAPMLNSLTGGKRVWWGRGGGPGGAYRLIGVPPGGAGEVIEALQALAAQRVLAETSCVAHAELTRMAHHDQLTTMPNRGRFFDRLVVAVDEAAAVGGAVGLLIIDLDDFKQINDRHGHLAGDELLVEVAQRITAVIGAHGGLCARFGGDEFAALLTGLEDPGDATRVAHDLRERLLEPVRLSAATVTAGASIGLAVAVPGVTAGDLIRCADIAMYSAKAHGKNRIERFVESRHGEVAHVRMLENHLLEAMPRGEIVLRYQPLVELATGRPIGVEALARWEHPVLGTLPPGVFVPLADRLGHSRPLGLHVLRTACAQLAAWHIPEVRQLRLAVNVSGLQLADPGFAALLREVLAEHRLPAHRLTLELQEAELPADGPGRAQLSAVAALGVRIAIDDFGAGSASLAGLRTLPVHQLKIDHRHLGPPDDPGFGAMVDLIMSVSGFIGLETVAEAVESDEHAAWAARAGMTLAQGYRFAPPMHPDELPAWIARTVRAADRDRGQRIQTS
jgi:diguanylate cyclase (GGDEF)-like protein